MPYRRSAFAAGEHYHIFNRGNNYGGVFIHREDYLLFLHLIRKYLVAPSTVELLAYCLMPNHFHLLVRLLSERLSASMQAMTLAYTKTINHKYGRVGSLFQGRFKAIRVVEPAHLDVLTAYIHENPVKARLVRRATDWEYSSRRDGSLMREAADHPDRGLLGENRSIIEALGFDGGEPQTRFGGRQNGFGHRARSG